VSDNNRWPQVGDLITAKFATRDKAHIGLIYKIETNPYGIGSGRVFVEWSGPAPYDYNRQYGYSPINIHNQYSVFSLTKARCTK